MKKLIFLVLYCLLLSPTYSKNKKPLKPRIEPISSYAPYFIVYDFNNNKVLSQQNMNTVKPIASLTKLMTATIFLTYQTKPELCLNYLNYEDIDILKHTHSRLPIQYPISCNKLLETMLISSDNMAASALARSIPTLTKSQFIEQMNLQAIHLGMNHTSYYDSSGLSPLNQSSAYDLILLMKKVKSDLNITNITAKQHTIVIADNGHIIDFKNTNKLIRDYGLNALLSKTGYIKESGYNLIYIHKTLCQNKQIGMVLLGAKNSAARSQQAMKILQQYNCNLTNHFE